ncbi:hypothetical protein BRAS3809_6450002 [Bradyrhizobium sp. STM 3809]|nr:hypothetical protein BRAS3809_6450002 [Bradyrhizobium sp. STM 3809]
MALAYSIVIPHAEKAHLRQSIYTNLAVRVKPTQAIATKYGAVVAPPGLARNLSLSSS